MSEKQYVALKQILLGADTIRPGEPVPVLPGRSYHQMLSLGQIAEKPEHAVASLPDGAYSAVLLTGSAAVFVDHEGQPTEVTYQGLQEPDEAARVTLDLEPGQWAALVLFPDDVEPSLVGLGSLTWGDAAQLLVSRLEETEAARADLVTRLTTAASEASRSGAALQSQVDWLTLLLSAVQAQGTALPEDAPGVKELAATGVTTREGAALLAATPANLLKVKGIGQATADKLVAWLAPPPGA